MVEMLIKKAYEQMDAKMEPICFIRGKLIHCECRGDSTKEEHTCNNEEKATVEIYVGYEPNKILFYVDVLARSEDWVHRYNITKKEAEELFSRATEISFNF